MPAPHKAILLLSVMELVFTLVKGSIFVKNDMIEFLRGERVNDYQPEDFLSEEASIELMNLFERFN